jgi:hypothetical protein
MPTSPSDKRYMVRGAAPVYGTTHPLGTMIHTAG